MPQLQALYTLEVKDKNGKTVSKETKPCKSFVLQFLQVLEGQLDPDNSIVIKDTSNVDQTCDENEHAFDISAIVGTTTYGLLVGTGTTPVTTTDYTMETLIAHGTGAGELSYGVASKVTTAEVGVNVDFQTLRTFTNTSGNTINVTEIGLACVANLNYLMLILHEIVASTPVLNGQTLTVTITLRTTV